MHHNLACMRLLMHGLLLLSIRSLSCLTVPHFHILIALAFLFFIVIIFTTTALGFEILTAGIRVIMIFGTSCLFSTSHFFVFTGGFGLLGSELSLQTFLELNFFGTIVGTVVFHGVSFRLLRWEFSRRRVFCVPVE